MKQEEAHTGKQLEGEGDWENQRMGGMEREEKQRSRRNTRREGGVLVGCN